MPSSRPPGKPSTRPDAGGRAARALEPPLGPRHPAVRGLARLLRDRDARDSAGAFVLEGPRLLDAALDRGAPVAECYVGPEAGDAAAAAVARAQHAGARVRRLAPGVARRVGDTVTPQAVFAVAPIRRAAPAALRSADLVVVAAHVADPGNAGTLLRGAEAAGAGGIVLGAGSVDAYNPKVVRASAGAICGVPVVEGVTAVEILETLGGYGLRRLGAVPAGGDPPDAVDLTVPVALVVGHEARGLGAGLPLDGLVTVPMTPPAESLNLAMAGTLLLFEAARQRRGSRGPA